MKKVAVHSRSVSDTPLSAPQAQCNCGCKNDSDYSKLLKDESKQLNDAMHNLDVADKGTEINCAIQNKLNKTYAFVLHKDGSPLMPMVIGKAKKMIRCGKAIIVKHKPLVIQLTYETDKHVEELNLGIDSGAVHIGYSVISGKLHREYIRGTLEQEHNSAYSNPSKQRIDDRRMYRRQKRNRLWHREPRFDNRKKRFGLLPPTIERKYLSHKNLILKLFKFLPIKNLIVEVAKFDIQKILNPDIKGVEYQQGDLYNYNNVRSYLMSREQGKCQFCGESFEGRSAHIHHIIPRSKGGTDRVSNLAILHKECHEKIHRENLLNSLSKPKLYKEPTFMASINRRFWKDFPDMKRTFGNYTFVNRVNYHIEKSHSNDAFVIAGGTNEFSRSIERNLTQVRRNDRCLQQNNVSKKSSKTGIRIRKGRKQFHKGDKVFIDGEWKECLGMINDSIIIGYKLSKSGNKSAITKTYRKVEKSYRNCGIYFL